MKKAFTFILAVFFCGALFGQASDTVNIYTFGGIQNESCNQVKPTADGGYITIGTTNSFGSGNTDFYVIKTDSNCKKVWSNFYGGVVNEEGYSVTQTFDGGYAFVGFTDSWGNGGYDVYLVKTDSKGTFQWQKTYGGTDWDFGYAIQQLPDSGFVIAGLTYSFGKGNGDMYVIRADKFGDTLWTRTIGDTGYDVGNAIYVQGDSLYTIVGASTSYNNAGDTNGLFVQIYKNGNIKKVTNYFSTHNNTFSSIVATSDSGFFIYGRTDSLPDSTNLQKKSESEYMIDKTGKMNLNLINYTSGIGTGRDCKLLFDSTFITLGSNNGLGAGGFDFHMQHVKPNGYFLSGYSYGGSDDELAGSIAISKNGDIVLGGSSDSPGWTCGLYDVCLVLLKRDSLFPISFDTVLHRYCDSLSPSGIPAQTNKLMDVRVFPNPISNQGTVLIQNSGFASEYFLSLYNESGQLVSGGLRLHSAGHGLFSAIIQKGNLPSGDYIYVVNKQDGTKVADGKIIFE